MQKDDEEQIKREAQILIEKTKKLMSTLGTKSSATESKLKSKTDQFNSSNKLSTNNNASFNNMSMSMNNNINSYANTNLNSKNTNLNYPTSSILKNSNSNIPSMNNNINSNYNNRSALSYNYPDMQTVDKNLINVSLIGSNADSKITIQNMAKRISELTLQIKTLEKENKDKDELIKKLNRDLSNKNDSINNLNMQIINERSDDCVVENSKLKRINLSLEQKLNENSFMYEQTINELKDKIRCYEEADNIQKSQIQNIIQNNQEIQYQNQIMEKDLFEKSNQIDIYSNTIKNNSSQDAFYRNRIEKLENQIQMLLQFIRKLNPLENQNYAYNKQIYDKLNTIFK